MSPDRLKQFDWIRVLFLCFFKSSILVKILQTKMDFRFQKQVRKCNIKFLKDLVFIKVGIVVKPNDLDVTQKL